MKLRPRLVRAFAVFICFFVGLLGVVSVYYVPFKISENKQVLIRPGASLGTISLQLQEKKIIGSSALFSIVTRLRGLGGHMQAGEYNFSGAVSMAQIADRIHAGNVHLYAITLAEGLSSAQIVDTLNATPFLSGIIDETPSEGSLLPDTYYVPRDMARGDVITKMQSAMEQFMKEAWSNRAADLPLKSIHEVITLASIVEKETAIDEERGLVASVFVNRLLKGMRLQSDPTIIYGLTDGKNDLGRPIRRSEILKKTPFNTYVVKGLPPTPIANPGRASIRAVLDPPETEYLFFVADGKGGHFFARTLEEHNTNVRKWRTNR